MNDTTTGRSLKAAIQKVAFDAITQNSEETYPSKRERHAGAYPIARVAIATNPLAKAVKNIPAPIQSSVKKGVAASTDIALGPSHKLVWRQTNLTCLVLRWRTTFIMQRLMDSNVVSDTMRCTTTGLILEPICRRKDSNSQLVKPSTWSNYGKEIT